MANQSCTKVAPVRQAFENESGQRMIDPVMSMTTMAEPMNAAFSFWPGLNFPSLTRGRVRGNHQPRSRRSQRFRRRRSARNPRPDRNRMPVMMGIGSNRPE